MRKHTFLREVIFVIRASFVIRAFELRHLKMRLSFCIQHLLSEPAISPPVLRLWDNQ